MVTLEELESLLFNADFMMSGLEKGFWRMVSLAEPEIWDTKNPDSEPGMWVVAMMGNWCVYHCGEGDAFCLAATTVHGTINQHKPKPKELEYLMQGIIQNRFVL